MPKGVAFVATTTRNKGKATQNTTAACAHDQAKREKEKINAGCPPAVPTSFSPHGWAKHTTSLAACTPLPLQQQAHRQLAAANEKGSRWRGVKKQAVQREKQAASSKQQAASSKQANSTRLGANCRGIESGKAAQGEQLLHRSVAAAAAAAGHGRVQPKKATKPTKLSSHTHKAGSAKRASAWGLDSSGVAPLRASHILPTVRRTAKRALLFSRCCDRQDPANERNRDALDG
ncbi:hypothetical protein FN846DRAFT_39181 [Sphaerosporella brunnea]|uniref:Uncharacterized protein n=1 Tax=Sphaerosporella brunnea TaxID=1250544 RepID=A0A5J5F9U6_9PEZI|nr:hypothetical protein FN846DRAFT_39181 [Sphaerosporella brunnea]